MSNELTKIKGGRWDSNPRMEEPQSSALTTWLRPPFPQRNRDNNTLL